MKKFLITLIIVIILSTSLVMLTSCNSNIITKDTDFYISEISIPPTGNSVLDDNLKLAISPSSKIRLNRNGTATIELYLNNALVGILNNLIKDGILDDINVSEYLGIVSACIPGFQLSDIQSSLDIVQSSMGLSIQGLDFGDSATQEVFATMGSTGKIPSTFKIKRGFGIIYSNKYYIEKIKSNDFDHELIAVYFGEKKQGIEPYIIMQLNLNDQGKPQSLSYTNEMVGATIQAQIKSN